MILETVMIFMYILCMSKAQPLKFTHFEQYKCSLFMDIFKHLDFINSNSTDKYY